MIAVQQIDPGTGPTSTASWISPFGLYRDNPLWVPPILMDAAAQLNPRQASLLRALGGGVLHRRARRRGRRADRGCSRTSPTTTTTTRSRRSSICSSACDDLEVARALFEAGLRVGPRPRPEPGRRPQRIRRARRLRHAGRGVRVPPGDDDDELQPALLPASSPRRLGFRKEVDFVSCYLGADKFHLDERVHRIAERAARRSGLPVQRFDKQEGTAGLGAQDRPRPTTRPSSTTGSTTRSPSARSSSWSTA